MLILIIFGAICGALAAILGAGSSMMLAPLLLYIYPAAADRQLTIEEITSATLALTFFSTAAASVRYHAAKLLPCKFALILAGCGAAGSFISSRYLAAYTDYFVVLVLFGGITLLSFLFNVLPLKEKEQRKPYKFLFAAGAGMVFLLGMITGIIGIGGLALFMPYMLFVLRFPIRKTIGTTTFAGAIISLFAIAGRSSAGIMEWDVAFAAAAGGVIGGFIGPVFIKYIPDRILRFGLNAVLLAIIATVLLDIFRTV